MKDVRAIATIVVPLIVVCAGIVYTVLHLKGIL